MISALSRPAELKSYSPIVIIHSVIMRSIFTALLLSTMALANPRVLVYTATKGYRHESIPTAIEVLGEQAGAWNVSFEFTE